MRVADAVIRAGGIDPRSASFLAHFGGVREAREYGLNRPGLFRRGGRGLDQLAQELHIQGHVPDDDPQTLLNMLQGRKESMQTADDQARAALAYEEWARRTGEVAATRPRRGKK